MFEWMRVHKLALIVSCVMFAIMAVAMVEVTLATDDLWGMLSALEDGAPAWIWRAGGLLTWPVFMWLLLRDRLKVLPDLAPDHMTTMIACCVAAAVYGGGGLWVLSNMLSFLYRGLGHDSSLFLIVMPVCTVLPFVYVWVFVAIYGFGQTRMITRTVSKDWIVKSAIAAVIGVYGIGALIDMALAAVVVPAYLLVSPAIAVGADELAFHLMLDLCAVAISTGNFVSQWWAFKRVDECLDVEFGLAQGQARASVPGAAGQQPPAQPFTTAPAASASDGQPSAQVPGTQQAPAPYPPTSQGTAGQKYGGAGQAAQVPVAPVPLQDVLPQSAPSTTELEASSPQVSEAPEPAASQDDLQGLQMPRLVCTCGAELPVDARYLPEVIPACRFCPNCGVQLLP